MTTFLLLKWEAEEKLQKLPQCGGRCLTEVEGGEGQVRRSAGRHRGQQSQEEQLQQYRLSEGPGTAPAILG